MQSFPAREMLVEQLSSAFPNVHLTTVNSRNDSLIRQMDIWEVRQQLYNFSFGNPSLVGFNDCPSEPSQSANLQAH